ncbi:MAG: hypothetical protein JST40_08045 [Armatimonadetes bacterium]|nr:hypothetical protein [Armatimonadota bacterium]
MMRFHPLAFVSELRTTRIAIKDGIPSFSEVRYRPWHILREADDSNTVEIASLARWCFGLARSEEEIFLFGSSVEDTAVHHPQFGSFLACNLHEVPADKRGSMVTSWGTSPGFYIVGCDRGSGLCDSLELLLTSSEELLELFTTLALRKTEGFEWEGSTFSVQCVYLPGEVPYFGAIAIGTTG